MAESESAMEEITGEQGEEMTWNDFTVSQLKEELTIRGLETTGKKADLVARLEKYDIDMAQQKPDDGEGDEFVVWNADDEADQDAEYHGSNGKKVDGGGEEEEEENAAAEDKKEEEEANKATEEKGSKDQKELEAEFSISASKDKDLMYLMWTGLKIPIPFRDEVQKDLKHASKMQNIMIYPVQIVDLFSDELRPMIHSAVNVSTELDETVPGHPIKGYLRLKFGTVSEAASVMERLKEYRRDGQELNLKYFAEDDSEGHVLSKIKKEEADRPGPLIARLLFVGNLPSDVTEDALKAHFTDALRVILPSKEDATEKIGHAYLEYATESEAVDAAAKYHDVVLGDHKLYVIKSMTERVMSFGLLKDSLRKYWMDQIHTLEASKAKLKTPRELETAEMKLNRIKRRIKHDNARRQLLCLPVPESEIVEAPDSEDEKKDKEGGDEKNDKTKDDSSGKRERHSSHREHKSSERRRSSPPRRRFSPPRFRGGFRGSSRGSSGFRGGPPPGYGGGRGADRLVDQLQELVGALAHRQRDYGGGYGGRGGHSDSYYDSPPRGGRGGYRGSGGFRGDYSSSASRFGGVKRMADMDYGERKRHAPSDADYPRYPGGRGGGYSSYSGGRRGGPSYY